MLDLRWVVDHLDEARAALARRSRDAAASLDGIAEAAKNRRDTLTALEALQKKRNDVSAAMAKVDKKSAEFAATRDEMKRVGEDIKRLEGSAGEFERACETLLLAIPNLPDASVPDGGGPEDNRVEKVWGEKPTFDFAPRDHVDVGEQLGIFDFARAAKISGARFSVLRGLGARLPRALLSFMLDVHANEHGYTEIGRLSS